MVGNDGQSGWFSEIAHGLFLFFPLIYFFVMKSEAEDNELRAYVEDCTSGVVEDV